MERSGVSSALCRGRRVVHGGRGRGPSPVGSSCRHARRGLESRGAAAVPVGERRPEKAVRCAAVEPRSSRTSEAQPRSAGQSDELELEEAELEELVPEVLDSEDEAEDEELLARESLR
ncbi:hypothetical protein GCM10009594_03770 [Kocuria palustris]